MSEHRYDIRISESCVDPNLLMVERQDPDNFTRFQTRERCALEIAAYVFNLGYAGMIHLSEQVKLVELEIYQVIVKSHGQLTYLEKKR